MTCEEARALTRHRNQCAEPMKVSALWVVPGDEPDTLMFERFGHIAMFTVKGETSFTELACAKATLMREMENIGHLVLNVARDQELSAPCRDFLNDAWRTARAGGKIVTIVGLNTGCPEVYAP